MLVLYPSLGILRGRPRGCKRAIIVYYLVSQLTDKGAHVNLAERLRTERKGQKLSQEELSHRAGVSLRTYNALERGEALDPHYSTLRGIAAALGVPVAVLAEEPTLPKALAR